MRKFSSYGPIEQELHYYVPRQGLIDNAVQQLKGDNPDKGGHYITVWAPRQTGKTWIMQEVFSTLKQNPQFDVIILSLQYIYNVTDVNQVVQLIARELMESLNLKDLTVNTLGDFHLLFKRENLSKPLILILDEFDSLEPAAIAGLVGVFRHIYNSRRNQTDKPTAEKNYLLHSLALIGVRAVLGVENVKGSPFNVQRGVHIPNLTHDEVAYLFNWYQQESGQSIQAEVVERVWYEFQGQPGLTCWFGELLTETYNQTVTQPITMEHFEDVYVAALDLLPNNNILNIVSKAKQELYKPFVLERFQTGTKLKFTYDDPIINFLYMNGVIDIEQVSLRENYIKFPSPYVQKRLFNFFARELFGQMDRLYDPFEDLSDIITDDSLNLHRLLLRYEQHLQANREQVLKNAPRRKNDLRVFEAVFQFHLYSYLASFLDSYDAQVQPEFPTGNGQIDLLIRHAGQLFGLELKSFANQREYKNALTQATKYGKKLGLTEIGLVLFIETVDDKNRQKFEKDYMDAKTGVTVHPQFVQTGKP
ncbi:AAA-like domain-containing protein [Candidatus Parabeggiatoa sp. HSG14]|uniref:AAA-like domain-containing protein n=1 Tax=Candidatus Parabeggiatoa sp. HSG14 TaxID=3055593 RepID=UPI0025A84486|nr:AAA-like domain-containing protein [Thiotrichales bacterium HSG14]